MYHIKTKLFSLLIMAAVIIYSPIRGEIIFSEDFESGALGEGWEKYRDDPVRAGFETRSPYVHSGGKSYRITSPANVGEGRIVRGRTLKESDSWIRAWFLPGYETVYIRWYAKFSEDNKQPGMHWCQFWGSRTDNARSVLGGAGRRPDGTDRFIANVEPIPVDGMPPMGKIGFYTYWPDMKQSSDGRYWGNYFFPEEPFWIELGRWYCFEMMIKCNDPGKKNGEQALWIDGKEIMRVDGMRWRDVETLKLTMAMFGNYRGNARHDLTYWMDDLVISTEYVGPMDK
jgi:hypothetical protein